MGPMISLDEEHIARGGTSNWQGKSGGASEMRYLPSIDGGLFLAPATLSRGTPGKRGASPPTELFRNSYLASDLFHSDHALTLEDSDGHTVTYTKELTTSLLTLELESGAVVNVIKGDPPVPAGEPEAATAWHRERTEDLDEDEFEDEYEEHGDIMGDDEDSFEPVASRRAARRAAERSAHRRRQQRATRPDTVTLQRTDEIINSSTTREDTGWWALRTGKLQLPKVTSSTDHASRGAAAHGAFLALGSSSASRGAGSGAKRGAGSLFSLDLQASLAGEFVAKDARSGRRLAHFNFSAPVFSVFRVTKASPESPAVVSSVPFSIEWPRRATITGAMDPGRGVAYLAHLPDGSTVVYPQRPWPAGSSQLSLASAAVLAQTSGAPVTDLRASDGSAVFTDGGSEGDAGDASASGGVVLGGGDEQGTLTFARGFEREGLSADAGHTDRCQADSPAATWKQGADGMVVQLCRRVVADSRQQLTTDPPAHSIEASVDSYDADVGAIVAADGSLLHVEDAAMERVTLESLPEPFFPYRVTTVTGQFANGLFALMPGVVARSGTSDSQIVLDWRSPFHAALLAGIENSPLPPGTNPLDVVDPFLRVGIGNDPTFDTALVPQGPYNPALPAPDRSLPLLPQQLPTPAPRAINDSSPGEDQSGGDVGPGGDGGSVRGRGIQLSPAQAAVALFSVITGTISMAILVAQWVIMPWLKFDTHGRPRTVSELWQRIVHVLSGTLPAPVPPPRALLEPQSPAGGPTTAPDPASLEALALVPIVRDGIVYQPISPRLYISKHKLGRGGHGTYVFQGLYDDRVVAVKRMVEEGMEEAARNEVSLLIRTDNHTNVVRYHHCESKAGFIYLVLEKCERTLAASVIATARKRMARAAKLVAQREAAGRPLPASLHGEVPLVSPTTRSFLLQIVEGLAHLHSAQIVHRDVKPHNILLVHKPAVAAGSEHALVLRGETGGEAAYSVYDAECSSYGDIWVPKISDMGLGKRLREGASSFSKISTRLARSRGIAQAAASADGGADPASSGALSSRLNDIHPLDEAEEDGESSGRHGVPGTEGWQAPEAVEANQRLRARALGEMHCGGAPEPTRGGLGAAATGAGALVVAASSSSDADAAGPMLLQTPRGSSDPESDSSLRQSTSAQSAISTSSSLSEDRQRSRRTRAVDVWSLGCVLYYVIDAGNHPFGRSLGRVQRIMDNRVDLSRIAIRIPEAFDVIAAMVAADPDARPRAKDVRVHPFFWDDAKRVDFFCALSERLHKEDEASAAASAAMDKLAPRVFGPHGWQRRLPTALVQGNDDTQRRYDQHSLKSLVRLVRNRASHFWQLPEEVRRLLGSNNAASLIPFLANAGRLPALFMTAYHVAIAFYASDPAFTSFHLARWAATPPGRMVAAELRAMAAEVMAANATPRSDAIGRFDSLASSAGSAARKRGSATPRHIGFASPKPDKATPAAAEGGDLEASLPGPRFVGSVSAWVDACRDRTTAANASVTMVSCDGGLKPVVCVHTYQRRTRFGGGAHTDVHNYKSARCNQFDAATAWCARGERCDFLHSPLEACLPVSAALPTAKWLQPPSGYTLGKRRKGGGGRAGASASKSVKAKPRR